MEKNISSIYRNILQEQGVIDNKDTINNDVLRDSFDLHIALRQDNNYEAFSLGQATRLIKLFENTYPGVKLRPPILRKKSPKSIMGKHKGLEIENISKLACVKADMPNEVAALEKRKYGHVRSLNLGLFYDLLAERINENAVEPQSSYLKNGIKDLLYANIDENGNTTSSLGIVDKFNFNYYESLLLNDGNTLSKSSRTALARMFYAKIKSSKLDERTKQALIIELKAKYGSLQSVKRQVLLKQAQELLNREKVHSIAVIPEHVTEEDILAFDSIERLENPDNDYNQSKKQYDHRYASPLDRLVDEKEFLRCKDLIGMQLVIDSIPAGFSIEGDNYLNELIRKRDSIKDNTSLEFQALDQQCMTEISRDFMSKLRNRSTSWLRSTNSKIINSSYKHKDKTNGYIADHIKFELQQNPLYALELHVKSKYVEDISGNSGPASHSTRPGKERKFHEILLSDAPLNEYPFSQIVNCFIDTINSLPLYMEFVKKPDNTYTVNKYSIMKNLNKYHGDAIANDPVKKSRISDFFNFFYRDTRSKSLVKQFLPSYYIDKDTIDPINPTIPSSPSSPTNQTSPIGPDL